MNTQAVIVDDLDVRVEFDRLLGLGEFNYPLAIRSPELKIVRRQRRPNRLAFARGGRLIHLNVYPGQERFDVQETLLHELTHIYVHQRYGRGNVQAHGREFHRHLYAAMQEAYGPLDIGQAPNRFHGFYVDALRRKAQREHETVLVGAIDVELTETIGATTQTEPVGWDHMPQPLTNAVEPPHMPIGAWLNGWDQETGQRLGRPIGGDEAAPSDPDGRVLLIITDAPGITRAQVDETYQRLYGDYPGRSTYNSIWRLQRAGRIERTGHRWYVIR